MNQRCRNEVVGDTNMSGSGGEMMEHLRSIVLEIILKDSQVDLIIGNGGHTIKQLEEKSETKMVVTLEELFQEQERTLKIIGDHHKIQFAMQLVHDLIAVNEMMEFAEFVEIIIPGLKINEVIDKGGNIIKRLQEESETKMVVIQEELVEEQRNILRIIGHPQQIEYAKRLVYELIAENEIVEHFEFEGIMIPEPKVNWVIGQRGYIINRLQQKSRTIMSIITNGLSQEQDKPLRIIGNPQEIEHAKQLVYILISKDKMAGHAEFGEIIIPQSKVHMVIGKGGNRLIRIQDKSGTIMRVVQEGLSQEQDQPLRIIGNPHKIEYAKQLVYAFITDTGMKGQTIGHVVCDEIMMSSRNISLIVGSEGKTIGQLQDKSGAIMYFIEGGLSKEQDKPLRIMGKHFEVEHAKKLVDKLIARKKMETFHE